MEKLIYSGLALMVLILFFFALSRFLGNCRDGWDDDF